MSDLISRKGVVNWLENYKFENYSSVGHEKEYNFIENLIKGIQNEPTVEAKPVHGEWIEVFDGSDYNDTYECSKCGKWLALIEGTPKEHHYDFCPFCGCDMRGEKHD